MTIKRTLLAGVAAGPFTPGFVGDQNLANELAEIGVILLMFGVGLHFSLKDLLSVKAIAVPGAVVQIGIATLLGLGLGTWLGWSWFSGAVFGLALSTASTVVLLRSLDNAPGILKHCHQIDETESEADVVLREAMSKLFREEQDIRQLIKLKVIYEQLEAVTDCCKDVSTTVEGIVLENS